MHLIDIEEYNGLERYPELNEPYYFILLIDGEVTFSINFSHYTSRGKTILFLSPYQLLKADFSAMRKVYILRFHGDFYCIEYHKKEVACNGILFNNIYDTPYINVTDSLFEECLTIFRKIESFESIGTDYNTSIVKAYLQLVLALNSREKQLQSAVAPQLSRANEFFPDFNSYLDRNFLQEKSVSFYAGIYGLSVSAFSKKIKSLYGKSPSQLIQERLILEAKKLLHLTYKSIKEIAAELGFDDEFYFSRYFKKEVGVSPKAFRETVGISIAAK